MKFDRLFKGWADSAEREVGLARWEARLGKGGEVKVMNGTMNDGEFAANVGWVNRLGREWTEGQKKRRLLWKWWLIIVGRNRRTLRWRGVELQIISGRERRGEKGRRLRDGARGLRRWRIDGGRKCLRSWRSSMGGCGLGMGSFTLSGCMSLTDEVEMAPTSLDFRQ